MALPQPQQAFRNFNFSVLILSVWFFAALQSCTHNKKVYKSNCDDGIIFKKVSFRQLMDSISRYDQRYVEVSGKYEEDKELSALFTDTMISVRSYKNALWVNFSQDCPLYLTGTRQGLFEYNDGQFTQLNDKLITIRGKIDLHNKGSHNSYRATIDRISMVKL